MSYMVIDSRGYDLPDVFGPFASEEAAERYARSEVAEIGEDADELPDGVLVARSAGGDDTPYAELRSVVDYDLPTEERDYEEAVRVGDIDPDDTRHIFVQLQKIDAWLRTRGQ